MSIFHTSLYQLVLNSIIVQKFGDSRITVSCLNQNVRKFIEEIQFLELTLDIHHDECKLLVAVNHVQFALIITIEIHLPICIAIKAHAFFIGVCLG